MKITTIGIDLAKEVFQIHGVDEHGRALLRKQLQSPRDGEIFRQLRALPGWYGSMRQFTPLGEKVSRIWAQC